MVFYYVDHAMISLVHRYTPEIPDLLYRVMASSAMHGAQFGGLWVFADQALKNGRKTSASTIFACHAVFYVCFIFTLRLQYDAVKYAPDELWLF